MENFQIWFASSPLASFLRHFAAIVIASAVAEFAQSGAFVFGNWQSWLIAGLVAAVPTLLRWFNPADALGTSG